MKGNTHPGGHLGAQLEMLLLIAPRENVVLLGVETHAVVPVGAAVLRSHGEDTLHQVRVAAHDIVGPNAGNVSCSAGQIRSDPKRNSDQITSGHT
jgi:hypothetical protein